MLEFNKHCHIRGLTNSLTDWLFYKKQLPFVEQMVQCLLQYLLCAAQSKTIGSGSKNPWRELV